MISNNVHDLAMMERGPCFLILSCIFGVATATTCSDGWVGFQGSCYLFGHYPVHFTEAEAYCRQHNSHLIQIETSTENAFIRDRLRERHESYWWLGITDEEIEGIWRWFDSNDKAYFTDWGTGEPQSWKDEDCAVMEIQYDYAWADVKCTRECIPLCERRWRKTPEVLLYTKHIVHPG